MPIDVVVNGYFRSGTTFIWNYLKTELEKKGYLSFYEPLSPDLPLLLRKEIKENKKNYLHDMFVFKDYFSLGEGYLLKIIRDNPNANEIGILSTCLLKRYLDYFHELEQKVFLQPNRLHFHLDLVFENYTNKVVHIVRHPLDVWLSIRKSSYALVESKVKKFIHEFLKPIKLKDAFEIDKQYNWIISKLGYPYNFRDSLSIRILNKFNAFHKFVVVWTISNYYAIKMVKKFGGLVIPYEFILNSPEEFKELLSCFLGVTLQDLPRVRKGNCFKFDGNLVRRFYHILSRYKIEDEFMFIREFIYDTYRISY